MDNTIPFNPTSCTVRTEQITVDVSILSVLNHAASPGRHKPDANIYLAAIAPDMELTIIMEEDLIEEKHYPFSTTDKYFAEQSGMTSYPLFVCGQMVLLESPELAAALSALSQMEQEIIFLYYFQRLTHREIGRRYGRAGNTTGRRIQMILRRLRAELEGLSYEPATFL